MSSRRFGIFRRARLRAVLLASFGCCLMAVPLSAAAGGAASDKGSVAAAPEVRSVTLITGDVVRVLHLGGRPALVRLEPEPGGTMPRAAISERRLDIRTSSREAAMPLARWRSSSTATSSTSPA